MLSTKVNNVLAKLQFTIPAEVVKNATNLETNVNEEMCEKGHDSDGNPLVGIIQLNKKSKENGLHLLLTVYHAETALVQSDPPEVNEDTVQSDHKDWGCVRGITSCVPSLNIDSWGLTGQRDQLDDFSVTTTTLVSLRKNKRKPFAPKRYMDHSSDNSEASEYTVSTDNRTDPQSSHHVQCLICHDNFNTYPELVRHSTTMHQLSSTLVEDESGFAEGKMEIIDPTVMFKTTESLPVVVNSTIAESCRRHSEMLTETRYPCHLCSSSFSKPGALKEHMNYAHIRCKAFLCNMCSAKFYVRSHLRSHMKVHSPCKEIVCPYCEKRFNYTSNMKSHVQLVHERDKIKKLACEFCARKFNTSSNLKQHIKAIHLHQLPYACSVCHTGFWTKTAVTSHKCSCAQVPEQLLTLGPTGHEDLPTQLVSQNSIS